ncbi:hypothetical protein PG997_003469 [Apiospora hydei]|uniref:Uncharacterized protein n=1 Tax=Apiospora hydei TaxID=1337664 RepID=A0ABR1WZB4_9PEZI
MGIACRPSEEGKACSDVVSEKQHGAARATALTVNPVADGFNWETTGPHKFRPFKPIYYITMAVRSSTPSDLIAIDSNYLSRIQLRQDLIRDHADHVVGSLPSGADAVRETYTYLQDFLLSRYPTLFSREAEKGLFRNHVTQRSLPLELPADADPVAALKLMGAMVEDDLFLLRATPEGHLCVALLCCFPSGFDPAEKLGKVLKDIHGPVPSYDKIGASMERFFSRLEVGKSVVRNNVRGAGNPLFVNPLMVPMFLAVCFLTVKVLQLGRVADCIMFFFQWSINTAPELYNVSGNHIYETDVYEEDMDVDISKAQIRVELQTLTRLPKTQAILFSFKTYLYPVTDIKAEGLGPEVADAIEGLPKGNAPGMWKYISPGGGWIGTPNLCFFLLSSMLDCVL